MTWLRREIEVPAYGFTQVQGINGDEVVTVVTAAIGSAPPFQFQVQLVLTNGTTVYWPIAPDLATAIAQADEIMSALGRVERVDDGV